MNRRRIKQAAMALGGVALVASAFGVARSPSLRTSIGAAYQAFRDPSLIGKVAAAAPEGPALPALTEVVLDAQAAREFQSGPDLDLEDPQGVSMRSLSMPGLRIPVTRRTMRYVRFFAREDSGRSAFMTRYQRAGRYRRGIEHMLREAGLPEELVWLAGIESGFDPRATSPAGAVGLWQFMPETGMLYGLDQSQFVDERRSIPRSTTAAVAHLRDLYERFGRWDLALAAYNCGTDGVLRAMQGVAERRDASEREKPITFADLAAARLIPEETANYVPQISAFAIVAQNRDRFALDGVAPADSMDMGELAVPQGTRLRTIARAAGVSTLVIRDYNPELLRDRVPPTGGDYLVQLPADRVTHTLAAFPAYLDQESTTVEEGGEVLAGGARTVEPDSANKPAGEGELAVPIEDDLAFMDDPLPRRPFPLGRNRLPTFPLPGQGPPTLTAPSVLATLDSRLPLVLVGGGAGWQRQPSDALGVLSITDNPQKGRTGALEKQLPFLNALAVAPTDELLTRFTLPNGIGVELRQDAAAPRVAITVRLGPPPREGTTLREVAAAQAGVEMRHTVTVSPRDLDLGLDLAAARLRMLIGEASQHHLADLRRTAGAARRRELEVVPYGSAWLSLGDALFPKGHALAGTVIGAREDAGIARDMLLTEALRVERSASRATVTVVGDMNRAHARRLVEIVLGALPVADGTPIPLHPREERVVLEEAVPAPRALYGWIAPGEGDESDSAMRVAMEILIGPKTARLERALVEQGHVAAAVKGTLDLGARASIAAIEVTPAVPHDVTQCELRLDAELSAMANAGPTAQELAVAKALIRHRVQREIASGAGPIVAGAPRTANSARIRSALNPGANERLIAQIDEVSAQSVRQVVRRMLAREHRVVIVSTPKEARNPAIAP